MADVFERYRMTLPQTRTTLDRVDAWWRATNHLAAQLPGGDRPEVAAATLVYAHLNRAIVRRQQPMRFVLGLRHAEVALEAVAEMEGIGPVHRPKRYGLGGQSYALAYAIGQALDDPGVVVACLVGEEEALSSWTARALHDPKTDGALMPILYQPSMDRDELREVFRASGWEPIEIGETDDMGELHRGFAAALYVALDEIAAITDAAGTDHAAPEAHWPMLVLRTPQKWPPVDDAPAEWFDADGRPVPEIAQAAPTGSMRMSADD